MGKMITLFQFIKKINNFLIFIVKYPCYLYVPKIFEFMIENNLLSSTQPGCKPNNSCVNQLISIIHSVFTAFDANLQVYGISLDLSKAFDRVWHKCLLYQLKNNRINGNLSDLIESFLHNRRQSVVLNSQSSN